MVQFPNCKINIGLNVVCKRTDGYHNIETVFYPVGLQDALEIIRSENLSFDASGITIKGITNTAENNLCLKAYELLKKDFPDKIPPIQIILYKAIPIGAGLGGGSADGAFLLKMMNEKFGLQISTKQLQEYALQLGSDCPFFIENKPCFAAGRGEIFSPISLDLSSYSIILVNPGIHVSTKEAFAGIVPSIPNKKIGEIISQPIETWKKELKNDFEEPVFSLYPAIQEIKETLYNCGALYASMSGSGSTVFGIFKKKPDVNNLFPKNYTVFTL